MRFSPAKRERTPVAKPPPESLHRVEGGGPWGPTQFDLPEGEDNTQAVLVVAIVGVVILLVIAGRWALWYFQYN